MNDWGFVGDMIKVYHRKKWGKDPDGKFYVKENGKYMKGCYGDTEEEALAKYYDKVNCHPPAPPAIPVPTPIREEVVSYKPIEQDEESYTFLAVLMTLSGIGVAYLGYRVWNYFM